MRIDGFTKGQNKIEKFGDNVETEVQLSQIDEESLTHIIGLLSNIYRDPQLAVIREYSTNAVDAHVEVGKANVPIQVRLPTESEPIFAVRDFGRGLTKEMMFRVFKNYGSSSKRTTNELTGGLGIGAKSAFAVTDNFSIVSVTMKDGVKTRNDYFYAKNEDGHPALELLISNETDEATGIEVKVPVEKNAISQYRAKALALFSYFRVRPHIIDDLNFYDNKSYDPDSGLRITNKNEGSNLVVLHLGNQDMRYFSNNASAAVNVIQGDIPYVLKLDELNKFVSKDEKLRNRLLNLSHLPIERMVDGRFVTPANLDIFTKIGTINITPSREDLLYTQSSVTKIVELLEEANSVLATFYNENVGAPSPTYDWYRKHVLYLASLKTSGGTWRNKTITEMHKVLAGTGTSVSNGQQMHCQLNRDGALRSSGGFQAISFSNMEEYDASLYGCFTTNHPWTKMLIYYFEESDIAEEDRAPLRTFSAIYRAICRNKNSIKDKFTSHPGAGTNFVLSVNNINNALVVPNGSFHLIRFTNENSTFYKFLKSIEPYSTLTFDATEVINDAAIYNDFTGGVDTTDDDSSDNVAIEAERRRREDYWKKLEERRKARIRLKSFKLDIKENIYTGGYASNLSFGDDTWVEATIDGSTEGYFAPLMRYNFDGAINYKPQQFLEFLNRLHKNNEKLFTRDELTKLNIIGIKRAEVEKVTKGCKKLKPLYEFASLIYQRLARRALSGDILSLFYLIEWSSSLLPASTLAKYKEVQEVLKKLRALCLLSMSDTREERFDILYLRSIASSLEDNRVNNIRCLFDAQRDPAGAALMNHSYSYSCEDDLLSYFSDKSKFVIPASLITEFETALTNIHDWADAIVDNLSYLSMFASLYEALPLNGYSRYRTSNNSYYLPEPSLEVHMNLMLKSHTQSVDDIIF